MIVCIIYLSMQSSSQARGQRIRQIRQSLQQNAVICKNSLKVQAKQQRNLKRRLSLQQADVFQTERLLRRFSNEDEEEDQNYLNSFSKKYELKHKIGEGANAIVHACHYRGSNTTYAVKIITMDEEHLLQLKKNFLSIRQLQHTSIIKYHALYFGLQKRVAYLIMEYFPFPNLLQLGDIQEKQLKVIFACLFEAVNYMHDRNICHRDLKPENVLYNMQDKTLKIIDFGISKKTYHKGVKTQLLTIIGTPAYLAPEILIGGGYDEKIDLWSIGVTLYRMITGVTPFESEYHSDTAKICFQPTVWAKWSLLAKDLVSKLLKKREQRISGKQACSHNWFDDCQRITGIPENQESFMQSHTSLNHSMLPNDHSIRQAEGDRYSPPSWLAHRKISKQLLPIYDKQLELQGSSDDESSPSTVHSIKQQTKKNGLAAI